MEKNNKSMRTRKPRTEEIQNPRRQINKLSLFSFILLIIAISIFGWIYFSQPFGHMKLSKFNCDSSILIKNREGVIDWIYEQAQRGKVNNFIGMPRRQIEEWVPILEEGETPLLTAVVITFESRWNQTYTSPANAIGLGGIWPSDFNVKMLKEAGIIKEDIKELYLPDVNIRATQFMINHMREHGDGDIDKCFRFYRGLKIDKNGNPDPKDLKKLKEYTSNILKAYWQLHYINNHPIEKVDAEIKLKKEEENVKE